MLKNTKIEKNILAAVEIYVPLLMIKKQNKYITVIKFVIDIFILLSII